jgi:aryl-alcohol dehydrogenase-like predicted oxidoreductase
MQKINVANTALLASEIVLGTDFFGTTVSRELSWQLMDRYVEAGGNVLDTAEVYAAWLPGGDHQSEETIGAWLRDRRTGDQILLSTKGAHPKLASMDVARMSKAEIQSDLDSSLRRLGRERIDLYWLHRDAPGYPVEEILQSLESFRQAGKIRHAGFSNWTEARAEEARQAAERLGIEGFVASQNMWSLAKENRAQSDPTWAFMDESFALWHRRHGFAAFPFMAQASGYFRRLEQGTLDRLAKDDRIRKMFNHQENFDRFERIRRLQQRTGWTVAQIVLGYLTSQPFPVFPLVGPKTPADLEDILSNVGTKLSKDDLQYLEHGEEPVGLGDQLNR